MTKYDFDKITIKVNGYIKQNWGSPFIVGFMLLLVVAAVSLSAGLASFADNVAVLAYHTLVAGVLLQIVSLFKYRGKNDGEVAV